MAIESKKDMKNRELAKQNQYYYSLLNDIDKADGVELNNIHNKLLTRDLEVQLPVSDIDYLIQTITRKK